MKNKLVAIFLAVLGSAFVLAGDARGNENDAVLVSDNFDRFTQSTPDLGAMSDGTHRWFKRVPVKDGKPMAGLVFGQDGTLFVAYSSPDSPRDTGISAADFTVSDAAIHLTVGPSAMRGRNHTAHISYRAPDVESAASARQPDTYHVELAENWKKEKDVCLYYGATLLASADVAADRGEKDTHEVRAVFAGDRHEVWIDRKNVITFEDRIPGRDDAGYVGFGGTYSIGSFDNFQVRRVALTAKQKAARAARVPSLRFQGKRIFVIGTFDPPLRRNSTIAEEELPVWVDAGVNTVIHYVPKPHTSEKEWEKWKRSVNVYRKYNVGIVYCPYSLYGKQGNRTVMPGAEDIPGKVAYLKKMLAFTAAHPQTFGYYTFDEPENVLYTQYKDWKEKKDRGLAEWIAGGLRWTYDTLKAGDPDAYVMPCIAWWTTYKDLAPLYDVNLANEYPTRVKFPPLQAPLYNVVYDAAMAVEAVRATDRAGVIYMPNMMNIEAEPYRPATLREERYLCFAPITQGAMGIWGYKLARTTPEYRQAVAYPVLREIKRFVPWFLGAQCDERVKSNRDTATADYLKEFPLRVRTVWGEEKVESVKVPGVPDCSYILRYGPGNSYLLLAVSNRKEPMKDVTFALDIEKLPAFAMETLEWRKVKIESNRIRDDFGPFDVRAYVIRPTK